MKGYSPNCYRNLSEKKMSLKYWRDHYLNHTQKIKFTFLKKKLFFASVQSYELPLYLPFSYSPSLWLQSSLIYYDFNFCNLFFIIITIMHLIMILFLIHFLNLILFLIYFLNLIFIILFIVIVIFFSLIRMIF